MKKILMYKENIFSSIGILTILSLSVLFYSEVKEGYYRIFLLAMIVTPMVLIVIAKNNIKIDFIFAVITIFIVVLFAIVFWKYKDGFLFSTTDITQIPEEARSQFSFENELKLNLLFICSLISAFISLLIRFGYSKFKIIKQE